MFVQKCIEIFFQNFQKRDFFSTMNPSLNRRINIPLHLKEIDFFSFPYTEQFRNGALSLSLIRGW